MQERKRVALYLRVSTDEQTVENQRRELRPWAERAGHTIVGEYADEGISGAKGRDKRPALDALLKAAARREVDVVACWDVTRLGRSTIHMIEIAHQLKQLGVGLYFHRDGIDPSTDHGQLVFMVLSWVAEQERKRIRERSMAGQARARAEGKRCNRPPIPEVTRRRAEALLRQGLSQRAVRRELQLGASTVARVHRALRASQ